MDLRRKHRPGIPRHVSQMSAVAIIPARGGSKGIPFKNMQIVDGLPLVGHTLRAARGSTSINRIIVSTDSREIADYATSMGIATKRLRPEALSRDDSPTADVVRHELDTDDTGERFAHVVLLQPTSPLRSARHIDEAFDAYLASGLPSLVSVCDAGPSHPDYMYSADGLRLKKLLGGRAGVRRQDLPQVFVRNGAIYITATSYFAQTGRLVSPEPAFYVMDRPSSLNIDGPADLLMARALLAFED